MPILDLKAKMDSGKIIYVFYKKPLSNDRVILANSAMPHNVKMATMVNEAIRRLRNTSRSLPWKTKADILTRFSNDLRISGYNQQFREKVISRARSQASRDNARPRTMAGPRYTDPGAIREMREERRNLLPKNHGSGQHTMWWDSFPPQRAAGLSTA